MTVHTLHPSHEAATRRARGRPTRPWRAGAVRRMQRKGFDDDIAR